MPEEERLRLQLIAERIALIRSWTAGLDERSFIQDLMRRDAVALSLLIIGETARRLLDATKQQASEVEWPAIISLRNRIAHGYETVDHGIVWAVVSSDLVALDSAVQRLLNRA